MKKLKIAQIGVCHEHASGKMHTLRNFLSDTYEIVGVVNDSATSMTPRYGDAANLEPYKGLNWMTEEEVLNYPGLDAVAVEVPNNDLVPVAIRCMEHNLAMHLDKPAGEDLPLFGKLLDGCRKRNLPLQMGYMFRNNPAIQFCQRIVREKWLGDIFGMEADMNHNYGGDAYQEYIGKFKGGIMFNLGCHLIDFTVSMMGAPEKAVPFLKSTPDVSSHIKNNCMTVLEYPHATVILRCCSRIADGVNQHRRRLVISGTNGWIELRPLERFDGQPLQMEMMLKEGNAEYPAGTHVIDFGIRRDRYKEQLAELAEIIRGEMKNPYTYEHDYLVQKVTLAASGYTEWRK